MPMPNPKIVRGRGRSSRRILLVLAVTSMCAGCTDVSAIAKFAAAAKEALAGFSGIATDFAASAERRVYYLQDLNPQDTQAAHEEATHYKELEPKMMAAEKVISSYIDALATMASDSKTGRDASFKPLAADLESAGMSKSAASSGVTLMNKLADAAVSGYRSRKLGKVIRESNGPFQDYLKGMEQIVEIDYINQLANERRTVESYYDAALHFHGTQEPLSAILVRSQERDVLDKIEERRKAALAYGTVLEKIGEAHQKLYDADPALTSPEVKLMISQYTDEIESAGQRVLKIF